MTTSQSDLERLDAAASLLYSVGRADPDECDPQVQLHCLIAAQQLQGVGANATRVDIAPEEVGAEIRTAMAQLGHLPASVFALPAVLAAADSAQTALERHEDR